jgi:hypothetical protein
VTCPEDRLDAWVAATMDVAKRIEGERGVSTPTPAVFR